MLSRTLKLPFGTHTPLSYLGLIDLRWWRFPTKRSRQVAHNQDLWFTKCRLTSWNYKACLFEFLQHILKVLYLFEHELSTAILIFESHFFISKHPFIGMAYNKGIVTSTVKLFNTFFMVFTICHGILLRGSLHEVRSTSTPTQLEFSFLWCLHYLLLIETNPLCSRDHQ